MLKKILYQGDLSVKKSPTIFETVLGSCVAVCLWDKQEKFGGMCHYVSPHEDSAGPSAEGTTSSGDKAIPLLITKMVALGGNIKSFQAKIYGGALINETSIPGDDARKANVTLAKKILQEHGIEIVDQETGGTHARNIIFNSSTFRVDCIPVEQFYFEKADEINQATGQILRFIKQRTGHELKSDKDRISQIITKTANEKFAGNIQALTKKITDDEEFGHRFLHKCLIQSTHMFRDLKSLRRMQEWALIQFHQGKTHFNFLSVGCSTGEEVYSFAILCEEIKMQYPTFTYHCTGVDLDIYSLEVARKGHYSLVGIKFFPVEFLPFFEMDKQVIKVKPEVRTNCRFLQKDLRQLGLENESFDGISLKNVLLYFPLPIQIKLLIHLRKLIHADGLLVLGEKESIKQQDWKEESRGIYRAV